MFNIQDTELMLLIHQQNSPSEFKQLKLYPTFNFSFKSSSLLSAYFLFIALGIGSYYLQCHYPFLLQN